MSLLFPQLALHWTYAFRSVGLTPVESQYAFQFVCDNALTCSEQEMAIAALREKCEILWAQLDAIYYAYVQPGWAPPGAFHPEQ